MKPYRKRSPREMLEWIAFIRKKEEQKRENERQTILRVGKVAFIVLGLMNVLLFLDVYILGHKFRHAKIITVHKVYGKHGEGPPSSNMELSTGRVWTVKDNGYTGGGGDVVYKETLLFRLGFDIFNTYDGYHIQRRYDAWLWSRYFSVIFLVLAAGGLIKTLQKNAAYCSMIITCVLAEGVLLFI